MGAGSVIGVLRFTQTRVEEAIEAGISWPLGGRLRREAAISG